MATNFSPSLSSLRTNLGKVYGNGAAERIDVPDDKVDWNVPYPEYNPPSFTLPNILDGSATWADKNITDPDFKPLFNAQDNRVSRVSYIGNYNIDENGYPLNPVGRTGLKGRGRLGRWGPNHACDPIVTRWKENEEGEVVIDPDTKKPILQFVGIERRDTGTWAIPGGMVDEGEEPVTALVREFLEEVFSVEDISFYQKQAVTRVIKRLFTKGVDIYKGYVDDPRNTDNAWMETYAVNFQAGDDATSFPVELKAGSDAANVRWIDINNWMCLYANHKDFMYQITLNRFAHW